GQSIAVVGMSCRFPGANDLEEYWDLLKEGRCTIDNVPFERWGHKNDHKAGMLDRIGQFDADYFMIPEEDARAMDPQALLVLEESLKLWYHAGYSHKEIKGKPVGVYIGARSQHRPEEAVLQQMKNPILGIGPNYIAANVSHFFDLKGPSMVLDTACSSALVGMDMAVQALENGEIESAIVGGVGLLPSDSAHRIFSQRNLLSKDGNFHIFDGRSKGIVLGEGIGMVLLKTMDKALDDRDQIYAVIQGIAVNSDGRTAGPATPNLEAQKSVMERALSKSGIKAEDVSHIETNGSGSRVTDLLELKAIQAVYRNTSKKPCSLGSVKPNIGHPLCAEGIAGFIKVVLTLH
ncbi:polyketide synthase, partial [Flavivirga jejuensis]